MTETPPFRKSRSWPGKFRDAFRGIAIGVRGQSSFRVHLAAAVAVAVAGVAFQISRIEWCLLVLCMTVVLVAEMFNTALERLAPAIDRRENPQLAGVLDIAAAAVLLAAIGASTVGTIVFLFRLGVMLAWWHATP